MLGHAIDFMKRPVKGLDETCFAGAGWPEKQLSVCAPSSAIPNTSSASRTYLSWPLRHPAFIYGRAAR